MHRFIVRGAGGFAAGDAVELPREEAQQVAQILRACMEQVFPLKVPLVAEVKTGESWYETK